MLAAPRRTVGVILGLARSIGAAAGRARQSAADSTFE